MPKTGVKKVAFVASYVPRKCGIATFTADLIRNLTGVWGKGFEPLVVAMQSGNPIAYEDPVKFEIRRNIKKDYIAAADYLNFSHVDLISVQHEFGLFGGDAGSYLNLLLSRVNAPVVATMHTVLEEPEEAYFKSTVDLCRAANKIIIMNERGTAMLRDIYGVAPDKIRLIPHGIPDLPFVDSSYYKHKFGMDSRRTILTFGLLGPNKGIDLMLDAMPDIVRAEPKVLYIVLGATHPGVLAEDGEVYRNSLQQKVQRLGLQDHVIFHNRYVDDGELHNFLCAADIYVTPYQHKEQLTSGTLAYAVGTGKAVVSTPYWAAEELLAHDRGRLVPFGDSLGLAKTVIDVLRDETLFYTLRRKAYDYGRNITWRRIGQAYRDLFGGREVPAAGALIEPYHNRSQSLEKLPEPQLDHLRRLTDDTGMLQHAKFIIPDRNEGYCTDDNARALTLMTKYYAQYPEPEALRLFNTYLSFVYHAQRPDGTVRNFMSYDRKWFENEPEHDALGRMLWAYGSVIAAPPLPQYVTVVKDYFDLSVRHVPDQSPRGMAYSIFGMCDYLAQFPGARDIRKVLEAAAAELRRLYTEARSPEWEWFEDILSYDNAVLPHAMFAAGRRLENDEYIRIAGTTCEFLLKQTYIDDHFSYIGSNGWYPRGQKRALYDQQPIEAVSTVLMLRSAYGALGDERYLRLQRKAFDWFFGDNDLNACLYDFRTKGCGDGLHDNRVNLNQGAESLVCYMLALISIIESFQTRTGAASESEALVKRPAVTLGNMVMPGGDDNQILEPFLNSP